MHKLLISTAVFALLSGSVFAQQPLSPPPPGTPPAVTEPMAPPPPPGEDADKAERPDRPRHDAGPPPRGPDRGREFGMRGNRPPPPPPSKAAHFRVEDGDVKIDIKCAEDQPTEQCAQLLIQVLDRLVSSSDM